MIEKTSKNDNSNNDKYTNIDINNDINNKYTNNDFKNTDNNTNSTDNFSTSSKLFSFYRTLNIKPNKLLQITEIDKIKYLLMPTDFSVSIYVLNSLKLHFYFNTPKIDVILFKEWNVFIASGNILIKYERSEEAYRKEYKQKIIEIIDLKDKILIIFVDDSNANNATYGFEILNIDNLKNIYNNIDNNNIYNNIYNNKNNNIINNIINNNINNSKFFYPSNYKNKILIISENKAEIYNFEKKKKIFKFEFKAKILKVAQTSVFDVLGFLLEDNSVEIFDIRKGVLINIINANNSLDNIDNNSLENIDNNSLENNSLDNNHINTHNNIDYKFISFCQNFALLIFDQKALFYDLNLKKSVKIFKGAFNGTIYEFENEIFSVLCFEDSISIYKINSSKNNFKEYSKRFTISKVDFIQNYENDILLIKGNKILKCDIYKDEHNKLIKFDNYKCINDNCNNYNKDNYKHINDNYNKDNITLNWNQKRIFLMTKNKRVLISKNIDFGEIISADIFENFIAILTINSSILIFDTNFALLKTINLKNRFFAVNSINQNLIILKNDKKIALIFNYSGEEFIKEFDGFEYAIDSTHRFLACVSSLNVRVSTSEHLSEHLSDHLSENEIDIQNKSCITIYDIISGFILEKFYTNIQISGILFCDGLRFLVLLDVNGKVNIMTQNVYNDNVNQKNRNLENNVNQKNFTDQKNRNLKNNVNQNIDGFISYLNSLVKNNSLNNQNLNSNNHSLNSDSNSNFYKNLTLYKNCLSKNDILFYIKSLSKIEVDLLLEMILNSKFFENSSLENISHLLNSILLYKGNIANNEYLKKIFEFIHKKDEEFEEIFVKCLGFLINKI